MRTCLSREFAVLRREAAVFRGCVGRGGRRGRQRRAGRGNIGPTGGNISVGPYSSTAPPMMWAALARRTVNLPLSVVKTRLWLPGPLRLQAPERCKKCST